MIRDVICYSCSNSFTVDDSKQNGDPIKCKRCGENCYYTDSRELNLVEVLEVKEKTVEDSIRRPSHVGSTGNTN